MITLKSAVVAEKYQILDAIGSGGMGTVYKALHLGMDRVVAVKFLHLGNEDAETVERFKREAKIMSALKHRNLLSCYELGTWEDRVYVAMEYAEGRSLTDVLVTEGTISPDKCIDIGRQSCEALKCAHTHGVIHRDLKPSNLLLVNDVVKVIDFGLAKLVAGDGKTLGRLTETGMAVGTIWYMSPEQCTAKKIDARSDVYGLSAVLYHCLTGAPPFQSDNIFVVMEGHLNQVPKTIREARPDLSFPPGLDIVIARGLAKDPNDRYQSAEDFERALHMVAEGKGLDVTMHIPAMPPAPPTATSPRAFTTYLLAAVCLLGIAFIIWTFFPKTVEYSSYHSSAVLRRLKGFDIAVKPEKLSEHLADLPVQSLSADDKLLLRFIRADIDLQSGLVDKAATEFADLNRKRPCLLTAMRLADTNYLLGKYDDALKLYEGVLRHNVAKFSVPARFGIARCDLRLGRQKAAEEVLPTREEAARDGESGLVSFEALKFLSDPDKPESRIRWSQYDTPADVGSMPTFTSEQSVTKIAAADASFAIATYYSGGIGTASNPVSSSRMVTQDDWRDYWQFLRGHADATR